MPTPPAIPVAAAIRTDDGVIHFLPAPARHADVIEALHAARGAQPGGLILARGDQGFVMSDGTFANRLEAGAAAVASGRIARLQHPPLLYSEDLW